MNNFDTNLAGILAQLSPPNFVVTQTGATAEIRFGEYRFGLYVECLESHGEPLYECLESHGEPLYECLESHGEPLYSLLIWDFGPDNEAVTMFGYDNRMSELRVRNEILAEIVRVETMVSKGSYVEPFFSLEGIALRSG